MKCTGGGDAWESINETNRYVSETLPITKWRSGPGFNAVV